MVGGGRGGAEQTGFLMHIKPMAELMALRQYWFRHAFKPGESGKGVETRERKRTAPLFNVAARSEHDFTAARQVKVKSQGR